MALTHDAFLRTILSQPTAPFREGHVIRAVVSELKANGVPHFSDPIGNIVVGVASKAEYLRLVRKKSTEPVRLYIAHMDHPGFHGVEWVKPNLLRVEWHGGSPIDHLEGAPVWLADHQGWHSEGHLTKVEMIASGRAIKSGIVELTGITDLRKSKATNLSGGMRFRAPFWQEGELIYTKAADDLVGAFAICSLAISLYGGKRHDKKSVKSKDIPFIGLLSRAEEVGFIGTIGHFDLGWLKGAKRDIMAVSLETSRSLPGADFGKGPVVRLGDRFTVFHPGALRVFTELAEKTLPGKHQRRIMDGGTCEASAATVYGMRAIGISVPLGNYHNQSFEGGPDSAGPNGPAPEFVHLGDVEGMLTLCHAIMKPKLAWNDPWSSRQRDFKQSLNKYKPLLRAGLK